MGSQFHQPRSRVFPVRIHQLPRLLSHRFTPRITSSSLRFTHLIKRILVRKQNKNKPRPNSRTKSQHTELRSNGACKFACGSRESPGSPIQCPGRICHLWLDSRIQLLPVKRLHEKSGKFPEIVTNKPRSVRIRTIDRPHGCRGAPIACDHDGRDTLE